MSLHARSVEVEAATTIVPGTPAGECLQASSWKLPADTTVGIPASTIFFTADSRAADRWSRLSDMFTTAGFCACAVTHLTDFTRAASAAAGEPPPSLSHRMPWTRTSSALGATPYFAPPMMPATNVPWPVPASLKQSPESFGPTKSAPRWARPPNSLWAMSIPVSIT